MNEHIEKYLAYVVFPLLAYAISLLLTKICVHVLPLIGLNDVPGGRHIHSKTTPKGGGIAIAMAFLGTWALFHFSPWGYFIGTLGKDVLWKLSTPIAVLIVIGIIDDKYSIRARYKLIGQIIVGAITWVYGFQMTDIFGIHLNAWTSAFVTVFWIVGFINAFNLIDGMDGLAAGLAIVSSVCMASIFAFQHAPMNTVVVLCLAASCLGFLKYNFHPASIFMGDTGSMFLGFIFAIMGILASAHAATASAVLIPILASGVPVFDTILAIWRRVTKRLEMTIDGNGEAKEQGVMQGDADHLHHRIFRFYKNKRKAVLSLYLLSCGFAALAMMLVFVQDKAQGLAFLIVTVACAAAIRRLATIELWHSTRAILKGLERPHKGIFVVIAHPFIDIIVITAAYALTYFLFPVNPVLSWYLDFVYNISLPIVILHLGGTYKRFWPRACASDYIRLGELLVFANVGNIVLFYFASPSTALNNMFVAQHLFFFMLSTFTIIMERMCLRYVMVACSKNNYLRHINSDTKIPRVLLYGAGHLCRFYITEAEAFTNDKPTQIVGIIDDYPPLRGHYVYGYEVFGGLEELEEIFQEEQIDRLVITSPDIGASNIKKAKVLCDRNGVLLAHIQFTCESFEDI